jgi:hypothetical protein
MGSETAARPLGAVGSAALISPMRTSARSRCRLLET